MFRTRCWLLMLTLALVVGCNKKSEKEEDKDEEQESNAPTADQLAPPEVPAFPAPEGEVSFKEHVAPILLVRCGRCHVNFSMGKYSMKTLTSLKKGGEQGDAIVAGDLEESRLFKLVNEGKMPTMGGKLADSEIETLKRWIESGAKHDGREDDALVDLAPEQAKQMVGKWEPVEEAGGPGGGGGPGGAGRPRGEGGGRQGGGGSPGGRGNFMERIMENDKDGDGKLSGEEIPERMRENQDQVDTNGDGVIEKSELEARMERFRQGGPGGRRPGGGRPEGGRPDGEGDERPRRPQRPSGEPEV